jgi:hypothetical protein
VSAKVVVLEKRWHAVSPLAGNLTLMHLEGETFAHGLGMIPITPEWRNW